jgi:hypothetical protein
MTDSIWLPYHMGIMEPDGEWVPLCGASDFHANSAMCYEAWRFIELSEVKQPHTVVCEECKNHPDFVWVHLGSL